MPLGNVNLTPQLVQAVRDAVDIVSIASEHTRLVKAGRRYSGLCPIHKEKSPSFSVDPVQGLFYCFGCGAGGDAIKLHMLTTGDDFPAAIEALAMRYGIPLPSRTEARFAGGKPEQDLEGALQAAADFFAEQLRKSAFALQYLERRRIPPELIQRFGLGYAPEGFQNLIKALHPRISKADLEAAGLIGKSERSGDPYDRFRHRLMFPIHNSSGRLVGFGGRTLGDDKAKYINTNETDRFHKGQLLYGLHLGKREIRESGRAVLCEGYFDVIGTVACGIESAVAGMGTALTPEQAKLLSGYAREVVVAYDGDNAGENAFRRALPLLLAAKLKVRRARFPGGHDPDSLRIAESESAVRDAIERAKDAFILEIEETIKPNPSRDPRLTAEAAARVREMLKPVEKDPLLVMEYVKFAAGRLQIDPTLFERVVFGKEHVLINLDRIYTAPEEPEGLVRSVEEQVIAVLLQTEDAAAIPPRDQLPPAEVFFDLECRNIYEAFCALYTEAGSPPNAHGVRSRLGEAEGIVVRFARIMVEGSFASGRNGLQESLDTLTGRWFRQRRQEVQREIGDAQRRGDEALLNRLLDERDRLNRSLHRGSRPGANPGLG